MNVIPSFTLVVITPTLVLIANAWTTVMNEILWRCTTAKRPECSVEPPPDPRPQHRLSDASSRSHWSTSNCRKSGCNLHSAHFSLERSSVVLFYFSAFPYLMCIPYAVSKKYVMKYEIPEDICIPSPFVLPLSPRGLPSLVYLHLTDDACSTHRIDAELGFWRAPSIMSQRSFNDIIFCFANHLLHQCILFNELRNNICGLCLIFLEKQSNEGGCPTCYVPSRGHLSMVTSIAATTTPESDSDSTVYCRITKQNHHILVLYS